MYWNIIKDNFINILQENEYYYKYLNFLENYNNNILLYGSYGFPIDLFIDEILKKKFNLKYINKKEINIPKSIIYYYNNYFIEIDLLNPYMDNIKNIYEFILNIIKTKNIYTDKHLIIIKHIDLLKFNYYDFRIILERFSNNVYFICTTHKLSVIELPIKSRFINIRMKNFTHSEIIDIYNKYLHININQYLLENKSTNLIKSLFISEIEKDNEITNEFCNLYYPPLYDFIKKFDKKKNNLENIREFIYKLFQFNISISELVQDLLYIYSNNKLKLEIVKIGTEIDILLSKTNKGREPIYIENLLCQILL